MTAVPFKELFAVFGRIGLLSFGGPAGQIALMHTVLVDERKWLDEKRFLHALNFCMLLPGPEAMQLATYAGWLKRGVWGGILAGTLFVLPGFAVLLALSIIYARFGNVPAVEGLLFGLKAAVLAIVFQALVKVARRALKGWESAAIAVAAFVALAALRLPFPLVIALAGLAGWAQSQRNGQAEEIEPISVEARKPHGHVAGVFFWAIVLWLAPLAALIMAATGVFAELALYFSKAAVVTFGGAYAVLAYVGQQAVEVHGWLSPGEMLTGLGLAETTPGPLILVLVFVGFLGAFRDAGGLDPVLAGTFGAIVTAWFTFVPCFIWVFLGAPFMERLRGNQALSGALAAITAAVVGVIGNLSLWFAMHVLFGEVAPARIGPATIDVPMLASFDWRAGLIALAASLAVWRGIGLAILIPAAALAGLFLLQTG